MTAAPSAPAHDAGRPTDDLHAAAVERIVAFFEHLTLADVARVDEIYAPQAVFKDPFQQVQGLAGVQGVYRHMFEALEQPRFVVTGRVVQGSQCFLTWDFLFAFQRFHQGVTQTVHGASHLVLDQEGRITLHRDYWDAAEELYEKLPIVGSLMRWLKRQANR